MEVVHKEDINVQTAIGRKMMGGKMTKYKEWTSSYLMMQQLGGLNIG